MDTVKRTLQPTTNDGEELEQIEITVLLEAIYRRYGYDFRDYNYGSIRRRIKHRMSCMNLNTVSALQEMVLHQPRVFEALASDFTISVTEMFRDAHFFKALREQVLPSLKSHPLVRVWHAGCSTGEEVYSMAILLKEAGLYGKCRIYATDINPSSLVRAEKGVYPLHKMQQYTRNYLYSGGKGAFCEYYRVKGHEAVFDQDFKPNIVFAQHNLATDSSFNEFHLIICRNVLIYFNVDLQRRVKQLFYRSLASAGYLALGSKEGIENIKGGEYYGTIDAGNKIYRKKSPN